MSFVTAQYFSRDFSKQGFMSQSIQEANARMPIFTTCVYTCTCIMQIFKCSHSEFDICMILRNLLAEHYGNLLA